MRRKLLLFKNMLLIFFYKKPSLLGLKTDKLCIFQYFLPIRISLCETQGLYRDTDWTTRAECTGNRLR